MQDGDADFDIQEDRRRRRRGGAIGGGDIAMGVFVAILLLGLIAIVATLIPLSNRSHSPTNAPTIAPTGSPTTATPTAAPTRAPTFTPTTPPPTSAPTTATPTVAVSSCSATCPAFGNLGNFSVLASSTVTNTGTSAIIGDVGVSPGTSITGFPPGVVAGGTTHAGDSAAAAARVSGLALQAALATCTNCTSNNPSLSGTTLFPGVYCFTSSASMGILTLDAQGNPNATFIFNIVTTLTTTSSSAVVLTGGALACRVFWLVGTSATLGTSTTFKGVIVADQAITLTTTASVTGRLIALNAAVTLDTNVVQVCDC